ncbi:MAG: hypothetical protein AAGA16_06865, partial [Cyanobacteria bacterium P01_E01_bin.35]
MNEVVNKITKILAAYRYWGIALLSLLVALSGYFMLPESSSFGQNSLVAPVNSSISSSPGWHSVTLGAGGYVTGIYLHPTAKDLAYIRTDNGGFYRWQANQQHWQPIANSLPRGFWDYDHNSGGEALGLDPQNPDLVYIAVGKYTAQPGTIYKSLDRGSTWQATDLSVPMGGDEDKRWAGDRLVVSPFDSNLLLFGSRRHGLWRSLDGGLSWQRVSNLKVNPDNHVGVLNVAFDPQKSQIAYASVYRDGVYQSRDSGVTWSKLPDSPPKVMRLKVAQDGTVYVTSSEAPQVVKYQNGRWSDISPSGLIHETFNGLSLHPQAAQTLLVSEGEKGRAKIYYSNNGGKRWQVKSPSIKQTVPWLAPEFFNDHSSAIAFDPQNPQQVWLADWFSVWHTDNIDQHTVQWSNRVKGIEQTVLFSLISPPEGGILLSGIADQDGFYHQQFATPPQSRLGFQQRGVSLNKLNLTGDRFLDNYFQDTYHLAYCQHAPQNLVRVGGKRWRDSYMGVTSSDGGLSWQPWTNIPPDKLFMRVAIAPDDPQHFVVTTSEDLPLVTRDGGTTWQEVFGLPPGEAGPWNWNQPLAADGVDGDRFYYYVQGRVYGSQDGGLTFETITSDLPVASRFVLVTVPKVAGEIWLSLDQEGLFHSLDGGRSFAKVNSITKAHLVTVGAPREGKINQSIYVYGQDQAGHSGLFSSVDGGQSWSQINSLAAMPRAIKILVASQQQPGLIFAGTDGRGIYYQQLNFNRERRSSHKGDSVLPRSV